jgi:hypothetical protein
VHYLLESGILTSCIAGLAIMIEDNFEIVLILFGKLLDVHFIWIVCDVLVHILLLLLCIQVLMFF